MPSISLQHVVADLTVGKPELVEFLETETVAAAIKAIGDSSSAGGIPVWKKKSVNMNEIENSDTRQERFVGILNSLDIVAFLARKDSLADQQKAMNTPVSEVIVRDGSLLGEIHPCTRLADALQMMKQGVELLLVPKSKVWVGTSKRFSILFHGKYLRNATMSHNNSYDSLGSSSLSSSYESGGANASRSYSSSSSSIYNDRFHCLSREDVIRFLIGCLGALAPLPLTSITSLGIINANYRFTESSSSAMEVTKKLPTNPSAIAVVELTSDGQHKIIGDISACKLWKCDYLSAAWALANLTSGQFVKGVEDSTLSGFHDSLVVGNSEGKLSNRSKGLLSNPGNPNYGIGKSLYRGRSAPLTCKVTSSLAAVMAQMLSHRSTHVWVTEDENDDILVGVVSYVDILVAVTRPLASIIPDALKFQSL